MKVALAMAMDTDVGCKKKGGEKIEIDIGKKKLAKNIFNQQ